MKKFDVGDEDIVADKLNLAAELFCEILPPFPIIFGKPVFQRDDGIVIHPFGVELHHFVGTLGGLVGFFEDILSVLEKLAGRGIKSDSDFFPGLVSRLLNRFQYHFNRFHIRLHRGRKPAFVPHRGIVATLLQHTF